MRNFSVSHSIAVATFAAAMMFPAMAFAQGNASVGGFGGFRVDTFRSQTASLGGTVSVDLGSNVQVIGEAGRIGNVLPTLSNTVFGFTQTGLRASAFYGEGGVRVLASRSSHVTPYAEATAGIARLNVTSTHLGAIGNLVTSLALDYVGRTSPVAGFGGGVLVRGGPVVFDLGYRYKQVFANDVLQTALGFGQPLRAHQLRAGIGFRF